MNKLLLTMQVLLLAGVSLFISSCTDDGTTPEPTPNNITDIVTNTERFSSLLAALERTDLVSTIAGGEYTVFAPDNDAFATFLNGTALADVDVDVLTQILLNHVVAGTVKSTDLSNGYAATLAEESTTMNKISLLVNIDNGVVLNNSVNVVEADITADNGVIHEVDKVIAIPTVVNLAIQGGFDSLVVALTRTDLPTNLVEALSGTGPFTVFAPSNEAFKALIDGNMTWNSIADIDATTLEAVLKYHVVAGANVLSSTLTDNQSVTTFQGTDFTVNIAGTDVTITDGQSNIVEVAATDVQGSNGVVHVISGVLLP